MGRSSVEKTWNHNKDGFTRESKGEKIFGKTPTNADGTIVPRGK